MSEQWSKCDDAKTPGSFYRGTLKYWALVAWLLKDELGKKPKTDEEAHLEERQRQLDEFSRKRWREKCPHKSTVALNEEGNAGIYCVGCGAKLSNEC